MDRPGQKRWKHIRMKKEWKKAKAQYVLLNSCDTSVIYEMITLRPPFQAKSMEELYKKVMRGIYPKLHHKTE